jgi:uncharacterized protein YndB with AHSA1/START domain/nitroimidazol reductase NimA-like FMN-containing flavoprotein (pyridoxamine 5'-phosphate oxidase superfamily)
VIPVTGPHTAVRLERTIPAPPGAVYRAWLDPDLLARWMTPGSFTVTWAEVEERAGGRYRIWHADASGTDVGGFDCELAELVPDQRIVFNWGFVGPQRRGGPAFDSVLTITLREAPGGGTHLTLVHERLDDLAAARPEVAANVGPGWEDVLAKLPRVLAEHTATQDTAPAGHGEEVADLALPAAQELLRDRSLARLAYNGPDGFPRVIPIGFLWRDGKVIACTAPSSPKVPALSARPQVALTIDTEDGPASRSLLVRGVATIEMVDGVPEEYLAAAAKTMPPGQHAQFEAQVRAMYRQMARITIEPRWARYFDFGAGRVPSFLRELAGQA